SSRRRHTRCLSDWSSDVCSSDLRAAGTARLIDQDAVRAVPAARGLRPANFRDRPQGIVGDRAGAAPTGAGRAYDRLAARLADLRSEERRVGKERRSREGAAEVMK